MTYSSCPACQFKFPYSAARVLGSFPCPRCERELVVAEPVSTMLALCGIALAGTTAYVVGLRGTILLLVVLALTIPAHALVVALIRPWVRLPYAVRKGPWSHSNIHDSADD